VVYFRNYVNLKVTVIMHTGPVLHKICKRHIQLVVGFILFR